MFGKHCSDELLLAALDGELSGQARQKVASHLGACWTCRARQAELESQVHRLTRAAAGSLYPGADWSPRAARRFRDAAAKLESGTAKAPRGVRFPRWAGAAVATAAAVALLFAVPAWQQMRSRTQARAGLEQLVRTEHEVKQGAVHQVVRVELRQVKPDGEKRQRRLEVWSDPQSRRHAMHWSEGGELKQAAWRSDGQDEGVTEGLSGGETPSGGLADVVGSQWTAEEAEGEFLAWLAGRVWEPVMLSEDFRLFVAGSGTTLIAERRPGGVVRLTATRQAAQVVTEWAVEVDARTNRPRLQWIRWERPDAAMELRFVTEFEARVKPGVLRPAVFTSPFGPARPPQPPPLAPQPDSMPPAVMARLPVDLTAAGIRAEYALRRLPEDWVAALEVEFEPQAVVVRGVTATAAMRTGISQGLEAIEHVRLDVRSVEEAAIAATAVEVPPLAVESNKDRPYPLEEELAKRLEVPGDREATARRVAEFGRAAARLSSRVLAEAWALRRLAERYPEERVALVPRETRWLLDELRESRLRALNQARVELRDLVAPVLSPLVRALRADPAPPAAAPDRNPETELMNTASELDRAVRGLLAGAGIEETRPESAVLRLLSALEKLEPDAQRAASARNPAPRFE